ncbi:MAG: lipoyl(octanoyl) transferase LipB [Syntrophobacteraceae bacterium]
MAQLQISSHKNTCRFCRLGSVDYMRAWELQKELAAVVAAGGPDVLLLLEHPPTYTLGRRGGEANMLVPRKSLISRGAAVVDTDRGGDITFHGPGQLVGYPIFDLVRLDTGIGRYLRSLEEALIRALGAFDVSADRCEGYTGVWVGDEKIAAIGVKITARRITQHGFALNVNTDLDYFSHIVPCGIKDRGVTNLRRVLGREVALDDVAGHVAEAFGAVFGREMIETGPDCLFLVNAL